MRISRGDGARTLGGDRNDLGDKETVSRNNGKVTQGVILKTQKGMGGSKQTCPSQRGGDASSLWGGSQLAGAARSLQGPVETESASFQAHVFRSE